jgi:fibronectin type 3 domain-containing protein
MTRKIVVLLTGLLVLALVAPHISFAEPMLQWDAVTGDVTGYKIYYGTSSGSYPYSRDAGNVTQYPLSSLSLTEGTTYYFVVRAYNNVGESDNSIATKHTIPLLSDTTPPLTPQGVTAGTSGENIILKWQASTEADLSGYRVYYGNSNRSYGPSIPTGNVTSYSLDNIEAGKTYYLAVTALDSAGNESGYSGEVSATIPSASGVAASGEGPKLQWDAVTGAVEGYKVYYGTLSGSYPYSKDVGNVTQCLLSSLSLADGQTYYFVIRSYTSAGESDNSNVITYSTGAPAETAASTADTTLPAISITSPTSGSTYETSNSSIDLSGSASDNVEVNQVSWVNSKGGSGSASGTVIWSISSIRLTAGDNALTITAKDAAGNQSTDTLTVMYTPADETLPVVSITSPTSGSTFTASSSSINLSGSASDNVGVSQVSWVNSKGGSGTASGTAIWSISSIKLTEGDNALTITAKDAAGNQFNDTLTVTYTLLDTIDPVISITSPTSSSTFTASSSSINLSGNASDNVGVTQVEWNNNKGGSDVASGISNVQLSEGNNVFTVTGKDAAGNQSTDTLTVAYSLGDTTAPAISIKSPTTRRKYRTKSSSINLSGSASDNVGVSQVTWVNSKGGSGTANGTSSWSIFNIQIVKGDNILTVTAKDAAGNQSTDTLKVTKR